MTGKPEPLVPGDVDLRDFAFMPLDVGRLRDSAITDVVTGEEFRAAVLLWCAAWHQVPAGSLPNNALQLSKFAGYGRVVTEWEKVAPGALYGFVECSDGRLYHPVIAEKAKEAWEKKSEFASRTNARSDQARAAADARWKREKGQGAEAPGPSDEPPTGGDRAPPSRPEPASSVSNADRMRSQCAGNAPALHKGNRQGQGQGQGDGPAQARDGPRPPGSDELGPWLRSLVGQEPVLFAHDTHVIENLFAEGVTREDVEVGIAAAMRARDFRPRAWRQLVGWINGAAKDRLEAVAKAARQGAPEPKPAATPELDRRNRLSKAIAYFRGEWRQGWPDQFRPGHAACTTPADVIEEARAAVERESERNATASSGRAAA